MKRLWDRLTGKCLPLAKTQGRQATRYRTFTTLLAHNRTALASLADLEQLYYQGRPFSLTEVRIRYEALLEAVIGLVHSLETLTGKTLLPLMHTVDSIDSELFANFNPRCQLSSDRPVIPFADITLGMKPLVGAKAANLAVIADALDIPVPPGFAVTASAFESFLRENNLSGPIRDALSLASAADSAATETVSARIRAMILGAEVPPFLAEAVIRAYHDLEEQTRPNVRIAMRSSAVGEDTEATFAGQYETVLNVARESILDAYKEVLASKYSARAIAYRTQHGFDDRETPMCVIAIVMVDALSSGVLYSVDPSDADSHAIKIYSVWGLGERLVDGSASPDIFIVDRKDMSISTEILARKLTQLRTLPSGGTVLEPVTDEQQLRPSLDAGIAIRLAHYGLLLEEYFAGPQDIEWAIDANGNPFILQSRPLSLPDRGAAKDAPREYPGHPVLFSGGICASPGVSTGKVYILESEAALNNVPDGCILIARTASPDLARVVGKIRGLVTDVGSMSSHLASVAREFGVPMVVDAGSATSRLSNDELVTLHADRTSLYQGVVEELAAEMRPARKLIFGSPVHRRMRDILDRISPLNLTDPASPSFAAEECRTFHDIIRYTHERAMQEMFGMAGETGAAQASVRLVSTLPLNLAVIDLGGGLRAGLTVCDRVTPDHIESMPLKAIWRGFAHPGVDWAGTMSIDRTTLSGSLAISATSEFGEVPGGDSYAVVSRDYVNLSIRFAYHFATIDALCGENISQNYARLQFAGGAGAYYGRSLRVQLIGAVLEKMGFQATLKGDLLEASISRYDRKALEEKLDLLGRLLASSRLLDMNITDQEQIERAVAAFFRGEYDLLMQRQDNGMPEFYLQGGSWQRVSEEGEQLILQVGSRWGRRVASEVTGLIRKMFGTAYHDFLDTIEAYSYFPLAILKDVELANGLMSVRIKPVGGKVDRAGGIVFGMRNIDNYFVLRTNALEGNIILFEYVNGRRLERQLVRKRIESDRWHQLSLEIAGEAVKGYFNGELVVEYQAGVALKGFVGLWTKADSVIFFDGPVIEDRGRKGGCL